MRTLLLQLIALALLTAAALLFADGDRMKRAVRLIGGVAMATLLMSSVVQLNYAAYASELRKQTLLEMPDLEQTRADAERLDRLLIEQETAAYIWFRADELNVALLDVSVSLAWNTEGYWYPEKAVIRVPVGQGRNAALSDLIRSELGIPPEAQRWEEEDPTDELD